MKQAVLLHGTDANAADNWWPWLKKILEENHYELYAPTLPNSHKPNKKEYEEFLKNSGWNFADNMIIGHSSGATTALNLLLCDWFPKVKEVILLGAFLNENLVKQASWYEAGQFDEIFTDSFVANELKKKAEKFYFVHGSDDPYCGINDAKKLCKELNGTFIEIENGHHLWTASKITEIPQLQKQLRNDSVLR